MATTVAVGKNLAFAGETENLETGQPIAFDGEITLVSVELWHDRTHTQALQADYDVTMSFEGHDSIAFAVRSVDSDRVAIGTVAAEKARETGLIISPNGVGDAAAEALAQSI